MEMKNTENKTYPRILCHTRTDNSSKQWSNFYHLPARHDPLLLVTGRWKRLEQNEWRLLASGMQSSALVWSVEQLLMKG